MKKAKKSKTKKRTIKKVKSEKISRKVPSMAKRKTSKKGKVATVSKKVVRGIRRVKRYGKRRMAGGGSNVKPVDFAKGVAVAAIAGIVGAMIANKVPLPNPKLKAALPLVAGVGVGMSKIGKSNMGKMAAIGLGVVGAYSLLNQFKPGLVTLAGDDVISLPESVSGQEMLGYNDNLEGEEVMLGEELEGEDLEGEDLEGEDLEGEDLEGEEVMLGEDLDGEEVLLGGWATAPEL